MAATSDSGGFRVTTRDVYDKVTAVERSMSDLASAVTQVPDHEERIRSLEKWMYALPPTFILAALSAIMTLRK